MTYNECVDLLYAQLPVFHRTGAKAYKADLGNIVQLSNILGNPHLAYPVVHVAGTNGKGSVCHMLASVLQEAGYKTGLHTSPHIKDLRERMRVNGVMAPEDFVIQFVERVAPLFQKIQPSFFELTVAMSFEWFRQQKVEIAVIETGLGGRLDSTNIVHPILSIITNISLDHTDLLGNDLESIAHEKAGIIKPKVPVVIGPGNNDLLHVFKTKTTQTESELHVATPTPFRDSDLSGAYQIQNQATVAAAIQQLQSFGWNLSENAIAKGFAHTVKNTGLKGRWERLGEHPTIIADVCHNQAGFKAALEGLKNEQYNRLIIVTGFSNDKDLHEMIAAMPMDAVYIASQANVPRAETAFSVASQLNAGGKKVNGCIPDAIEALDYAKTLANSVDLILVIGSIFLVAEVL